MVLNNEVFLPVSVNILDIKNIIKREDKFTIPLRRTADNQNSYDEMYSYLGKDADFLIDMMEAKLNLVIRLNSIGQFDFCVSADYKPHYLEEDADFQEDEHSEQLSITLFDEELVELFSVFSKLFETKPSIEDLRLQVVKAIPKEHMLDTKLFAEEITQDGYRCVWTTTDFKKCVLALIKDVVNPNGLIKAYVFGDLYNDVDFSYSLCYTF